MPISWDRSSKHQALLGAPKIVHGGEPRVEVGRWIKSGGLLLPSDVLHLQVDQTPGEN